MVPCGKCSAPNDPSAAFCWSCGAVQPAPGAGATPAAFPPQPGAGTAYAPAPAAVKRKSGKVLKIIGIVAAVFFACIVALIVLGAIIDARNGGKKSSVSSGSGNSKVAATPTPVHLSDEELMREGRMMCEGMVIYVNVYLKNKFQGIECQPGKADGGDGIVLGMGYPGPVFSSKLSYKNTLYITFMGAGAAMSVHPGIPVKKVYVTDSSPDIYYLSGEYVEQIFAKVSNKQISREEAGEEFARMAQKTTFPQRRQ